MVRGVSSQCNILQRQVRTLVSVSLPLAGNKKEVCTITGFFKCASKRSHGVVGNGPMIQQYTEVCCHERSPREVFHT